MAERFAWKRFWLPRGLHRGWDSGFLPDPEDSFGLHLAREAIALSTLIDQPCLVLLGEPGAGKSDEVSRAFAETAAVVTHDDECRLFDFKMCSEAYLLDRDIFDAPWFHAWRGGTHGLSLWLDALDECQLQLSLAGAVELGSAVTVSDPFGLSVSEYLTVFRFQIPLIKPDVRLSRVRSPSA